MNSSTQVMTLDRACSILLSLLAFPGSGFADDCSPALASFGAACPQAAAFVSHAADRLRHGSVDHLARDTLIYNYSARLYLIPKDAQPPLDYAAVVPKTIAFYYYPSQKVTGNDSI